MKKIKQTFTIDEVLNSSPEKLAKNIPEPLDADESSKSLEVQDKLDRMTKRLGSLARTYKSVTIEQKMAVEKTIKGGMKALQDAERNEYINESFKEMMLESIMEITLQNIFNTLELKVINDKGSSGGNPFSPKYNLHELSKLSWAKNDHEGEIDTSENRRDIHATPNEREMLKTEQDLEDAQEITEKMGKRRKEYSQESRVSNKYKKQEIAAPLESQKDLKYLAGLIEDQIVKMSKKELLKLAKNIDIKGRSKMDKSRLISQILLTKRKTQKGK